MKKMGEDRGKIILLIPRNKRELRHWFCNTKLLRLSYKIDMSLSI